MGIGTLQLLIVFAFNHSDFYGDIVAELARLRTEDIVRLIDAVALFKDADGRIELRPLRRLHAHQPVQATIGIDAVIGSGADADERNLMATDHTQVLSAERSWDVLDEMPTDSAAALVLLQHHWAVRLHDAIASVGWFRLSDGFIVSPLDVGATRPVAAD